MPPVPAHQLAQRKAARGGEIERGGRTALERRDDRLGDVVLVHALQPRLGIGQAHVEARRDHAAQQRQGMQAEDHGRPTGSPRCSRRCCRGSSTPLARYLYFPPLAVYAAAGLVPARLWCGRALANPRRRAEIGTMLKPTLAFLSRAGWRASTRYPGA